MISFYLVTVDTSLCLDDQQELKAHIKSLCAHIHITHVVAGVLGANKNVFGVANTNVQEVASFLLQMVESSSSPCTLLQNIFYKQESKWGDVLLTLLKTCASGRVALVGAPSFISSLMQTLQSMDSKQLLLPRIRYHDEKKKDDSDEENQLCRVSKWFSVDFSTGSIPVREWMLVQHGFHCQPHATRVFTSRHTRSFVSRGVVNVGSLLFVPVTKLSDEHDLEHQDEAFEALLGELKVLTDPSSFVAMRRFAFLDDVDGHTICTYLKRHRDWKNVECLFIKEFMNVGDACTEVCQSEFCPPGYQLLVFVPSNFIIEMVVHLLRQESSPKNTKLKEQINLSKFTEISLFHPRLAIDNAHLSRVENMENNVIVSAPEIIC